MIGTKLRGGRMDMNWSEHLLSSSIEFTNISLFNHGWASRRFQKQTQSFQEIQAKICP